MPIYPIYGIAHSSYTNTHTYFLSLEVIWICQFVTESADQIVNGRYRIVSVSFHKFLIIKTFKWQSTWRYYMCEYLPIIRWHVGLITVALCFNNEFCTCVIRIFIFLDCTRLFCTGVGEVKGRTMSSADELMTNDEIAVNFFITSFCCFRSNSKISVRRFWWQDNVEPRQRAEERTMQNKRCQEARGLLLKWMVRDFSSSS